MTANANPEAIPGWFKRRPDLDTQPESEITPEEATSNLTTTGGSDDQKPVMVWEAANRMEAQIVAGRLHSEGIPAIIQGETLGAIYGLTTGNLAAATVWVPGALADKALEILNTDVDVEWDDADSLTAIDDDLPNSGDTTLNHSNPRDG